MGEHVVRVHDVGPLAFRRELPRQVRAEKLRDGRDMLFLDRDSGHVERRLDTQHRDAAALIELQEIAVVARDFDDEALRVEGPGLDQIVSELFRVLEHGVRKR